MLAGTYKAITDVQLLIYPREWADEFARQYELSRKNRSKYPFPHAPTTGTFVKAGQEMTVTFDNRRKILDKVGDLVLTVYAYDIAVKVGSKEHSGVVFAYNDYDPPVVPNDIYVKPVKKRQAK